MNRKILIVAISILALAGLLVLLAALAACGGGDKYSACVQRCVNAARDANIERDDITDEDYKIIMAEHKNYICPGKCEDLK